MDENRRPRSLPVVPATTAQPGQDGASDGAPDPAAPGRLTRRSALKVMAAAAALPTLAAESCEPAASPPASGPSNPLARGTPTDPDLLSPTVPWEGVLTPEERRTVGALCDVIIPADDRSPSASRVGVPDFIDEWISAPYPANEEDRVRIRGGLSWIDREANERFGAAFEELTPEQQRAICDDIRHVPDAAPELRAAARFFDRFRDLTASGYWTTQEGMADLGYVGNVPLASWDGPPPEVLERLGLG